jgi:hypothetical protein
LEEFFEDAVEILRCDADAGIRNRAGHALARGVGGDRQPHFAVLGVLHRVHEQVSQDLSDQSAVGFDERYVALDVGHERHPLLVDEWAKRAAQLCGESAEVTVLDLCLQSASLGLGDVEQLIHETEQISGRRFHERDLVSIGRR